MTQTKCACGHEMYDHELDRVHNKRSGACSSCWCTRFTPARSTEVVLPKLEDYSSLARSAPIIDIILERIERKGCPQGLNVVAEELRWMGKLSISYEKLLQAVNAELQKPHPRICRVSDGIYWSSDKNVPAGWNMFGDRRMLPCFYREYPPAVSWDDLDAPENILPNPR